MTRSKVFLVGAGALGSHAIQFMRNLDIALTVMDFDRVDTHNTLSQFYAKITVGKNKATALKELADYLFKLKITPLPHRLTSDNAPTVMQGADLIVDAVDNFATRELIQSFARKQSKPCLHGALAADGGYGRVVWDDRFVIDSEAGVGGATCENGEHLPFIAVVAAYLARAAQQYLKDGTQHGYEINPAGVFRT